MIKLNIRLICKRCISSASFPRLNGIDLIKERIADKVSKFCDIEPNEITKSIDLTNNLDKGDLIIPLPKILKDKKCDLKATAKEWCENIKRDDYISNVTASGPFIQFEINPKFLFQELVPNILSLGGNYGSLPLGNDKTALIEFSSPNIAKPFHAGHLRSTIIGGFLSNLYQKFGWNVVRMNYLGDWGKQFGILAVGYQKYGDENKLLKNPINHLFEIYVRINKDIENEKRDFGESELDKRAKKFFRDLEDGQKDAIELWTKFRNLSIEKYTETYKRLNIYYDVYSGESQVAKDAIEKVHLNLINKSLIQDSNGAQIIDLTESEKALGKVVIKKSDGTSLYITRDVAAAIERKETYHFDRMIYVVASQQDLHLKQLFEILRLLDYEWTDSLVHVNFGMVQGMSTRKGTVVFLDNILEEAKNQMLTVMSKSDHKFAQIENPEYVADLIGISAVMIQDMQGKRINNYSFNWERILSFEGDTGPYLQYAHSRLKSIEDKNSNINITDLSAINFSLIKEPEAITLMRLLSRYPEVLKKCIETHEPSTVVTYLFKVAHQVSTCYRKLWVSGQDEDTAMARLALYAASRQVLHNGMTILGITPVDRM
ncbi:Uncharacterized protein RNJ44_00796 [Nakaseomyces bracarensis]|uniref:arginine--tRNA ligase n=1 Tax=Nakaseomyces bracarensis TaxID=273131 RepID=A0ABR4NS50_9SACH